jgi:hypothetical protein
MLSIQEINVLGQCINEVAGSNWGASGTRSVTASLQGSSILMKFSTIVYFAGEQSLKVQMDAVAHESMEILSDQLNEIKKHYKDATGSALKCEEGTNRDDLEMVQATAGSLRKIAHYRRHLTVEIKN